MGIPWKLRIELPYDPAIQLLGIYPKNTKTLIGKDMFIAALFPVARTWKQSKCPSMDEWMKMWYTHTDTHTHRHTHRHTHTHTQWCAGKSVLRKTTKKQKGPDMCASNFCGVSTPTGPISSFLGFNDCLQISWKCNHWLSQAHTNLLQQAKVTVRIEWANAPKT